MESKKNLTLQRLLLISVFLGCGFLVLGASVFTGVGNQDRDSSKKILAAEISPSEEQPVEEKVDYYLVYPGILPDHFLYPLKMVRDRIWLILTTGPKRKAEVMLLFADKRLGAGKALIEGGKEKLGITTLTKGEKYLEQAAGQLKLAKDKDTLLMEKLTKAAAKHEEVLQELKEKVSIEEWGVMDKMLEKNKIIKEEIEKID